MDASDPWLDLKVLTNTVWVRRAEFEAFLAGDPSEDDVRAFIRQTIDRAREARPRDREN